MEIAEMLRPRNFADTDHALTDGPAFAEWEGAYFESELYRDGDEVIGVDAVISRMGGVAIVLTVADADGSRFIASPHFDQQASEMESADEHGRTVAHEVTYGEPEWLSMMAGATDEWQWIEYGRR